MKRLSDSEFAERVRSGNRQRAARQLEKKRKSGQVPTTIWLNANIKAALVDKATRENLTISKAIENLLSATLKSSLVDD